MARYDKTEQAGVHAVATLVVDKLGWIFREQPIADMGIDAHIELVRQDNNPTGQLIGVQIKSGEGNFHETADAWVYYGTHAHLDYWTGHALPVILVAHLPKRGETLWVQIDESTIHRTRKHWRVAVPKDQRLGPDTRAKLEAAFEGSPRQQRLRRLALHEPLMRHIENGFKVCVDLDDWYNKGLNRSTVQVIVEDEHGDGDVEMEWFQYFFGRDMKAVAERLFPWATARVDLDFYDQNSDTEESERDRLLRVMDDDDGIQHEVDPDAVYPYSDNNGEVASYRLQLSLNELGRAYLAVSDYLDGEPPDSDGDDDG